MNGKGAVCTPSANQCFDLSQCDPGENCVAGKCTPSCMSNSQCRDGYSCNTSLGVCVNSVESCIVTNDCGGPSNVCVGGTCVPRAPANSASCPTMGDVWTENGCIPSQAPNFVCNQDGVQDVCAIGSICLHHDCWISCSAPNQNACSNQIPQLSICEPVTSSGNTYNVCGSATNLGNQCGPGANNMTCSNSSDTCIDGFCK
jgi:hypothetical protein